MNRLSELRAELTAAEDRRSANERRATELRAFISEAEMGIATAATARALGELEPASPSPADPANLRIDLTGCEAAALKLAKAVTNAQARRDDEIDRLKSEARDKLDKRRDQAQAAFAYALEGVCRAAVDLMAIDHLGNSENLRDPRRRQRTFWSAQAVYGPAAETLHALRNLDWPGHPYSLRPEWLERHGAWWAFELPGVAEKECEIWTALALEELYP